MAFYYNKTKLPFDFTPQIFRYLEELIDIGEKTWAHETGQEIGIDNYILGEPRNPEITLNNGSFWHFLEEIGAVQIIQKDIDPIISLCILDIDKIEKLLNERSGNGVIRAQTLELIAKDVAEHKTGPELIHFLKEHGVPAMMIVYPNTKWRMLFSTFRVFNTSLNQKAHRILYKVIEAAIHPLFFDGDKNKADETQKKYNEWLKYDNIIVENGKIYIGPSEEEWNLGNADWFDADGNIVEPEGSILNPTHLAELWVLWNQIVLLVSAYQNNPALDRKELEKLYFEVIGKAENLIEYGELFRLKERYNRPFTSLSTADVEAQAKKAGGPLELIGAFLVEITALNPHPAYIAAAMEKEPDLIARVTAATQATIKRQGGNEVEDKERILKLEISKMPEVVVRNVEDNTPAKDKKRESPIELSFPEPVQWEKVTLKIKDGRQELEIFYDNSHIITADYIRLQFFTGKKQQKTDRQWGFLCALATLVATDIKQATAENMRSMITKGKTVSANNVQQAKKSFAERLKVIFQTRDDPFHDTRDYYEPKFAILPEPSLRREKLWPQGGPLNENRGDETDRLAYEEKRTQEESEEEAL
jgi:hypothetical protein